MAQFSEDAIKEITDYIEVQGRDWARQYIEGRIAYFGKKKLKSSGELMQSMQSEIVSTLQQGAETRITLAFSHYGRFIDMKFLKAAKGGERYMKALADWIKEKDLAERFAKKRGLERRLRAVPNRVLNRMAWGIIKNRHDKYKRRLAWYSKSRTGAINDLYNKVAANIPHLVGQEIKKAFKNAQ